MAADIFIYFDKPPQGLEVKGETQDDDFSKKFAFELKDWSVELTNKSTVGSGTQGFGSGKCEFGEFNITKVTDLASPNFFRNCCSGAVYPNVTLAMRKAGGKSAGSGLPFITYTFTNVYTTKISWESGDDAPTEKITFVYGRLAVEYAQQKPTGEPGTRTSTGWDQLLNKSP